NQFSKEAEPLLSAIERAVVSAMSPAIARDDGQLVRAPQGGVYRIIITRQIEFYDGSRLINMYLIPILRLAFLDDSALAVTLGFIQVAIRYREMFANPARDLSYNGFYLLANDPVELRERVQRAMRELLLIEDEVRILKLDKPRAISYYYGGSPDDGKQMPQM